ncbi:uncharacterized protein LOC125419007 [Ziziphus jujuba]|uniref:Uncharacterized protein LOC125419007 n=1 Tax=Ziziphus jujuba TaxID=326968 RepID=A0ABM3I3A9_ZIZJJ|nr:uncharacterized protein LOC125419007 [Ziziphus jujuba]
MDENTLIGGDIFGGLVPLCHVSASQEDHLRRCPFAPEPYDARPSSSDSDSDPDAIPVESTGIMMVSPPDSLEFRDNNNNNNNNSTSHDVFQTPPEDSTMFSSEEQNPPPAAMEGGKHEGSDGDVAVDGGSETVVVDLGCVDDSGTGTVELGLDSELGFSEIQEVQRVNSQSESLGFRVLSAEEEEEEEEGLDEQPPLKKSKIPPQNSGKSAGGLESETVNRHDHRSRSCQNVEFNGGGGDAGFGEESSAKRKLEFEVVQLEIEPNGRVLEGGNAKVGVKEGVNNEGVLGLNELQSSGQEKEPAGEFMEAERGKCQGRLLPNWIHGVEKNENEVRKAMTKNENKVRKVQLSRVVENFPFLHALKLLKELDDKLGDDSFPGDGFVEICKQQGIIFPRPSWWPERGFNLIDNNDYNDE